MAIPVRGAVVHFPANCTSIDHRLREDQPSLDAPSSVADFFFALVLRKTL
jgi:hypothetical protein